MAKLFQSTDFTCGPVCLKMAMHRLDPLRPLAEVNEFLIWREANSVFMGHGHAGCTPHGLGRSAVKRGFTARILTNDLPAIETLFEEDVLKESEKKIYTLVNEHDHECALKEGVEWSSDVPYSQNLLRDLLWQGKVPIILVRAFSDQEAHWVLIDRLENGIITVIDPFEKHAAHPSALEDNSDANATHAMPLDEFETYCLHGKTKAYAILAIGRANLTK